MKDKYLTDQMIDEWRNARAMQVNDYDTNDDIAWDERLAAARTEFARAADDRIAKGMKAVLQLRRIGYGLLAVFAALGIMELAYMITTLLIFGQGGNLLRVISQIW